MEIEIDSKRNNPLLKRTEIYFTIKHEGEGTPNREIIKSELAEKLNVKKESIIVSSIDSGFGIQQVSGYAKVYSSDKKTKDLEPDYILKRNKLIAEEKKAEKKEVAPAKPEVKPEEPAADDKSAQPTEEPSATDQPKQDSSEEKPVEKEEVKPEEKKPASEETKSEIKEEPKPEAAEKESQAKESEEKKDEPPAEEKKKEEKETDEKSEEKKE